VASLASQNLLILAGLFRGQIAGLSDPIQIQASGRKFGDLTAATGGESDVENLGAHHGANRAFIHGEVVAAQPVPAFEVVAIIDANLDLQLWLSPETGAIRGK